jgi:benzaldehyde dehydrogenase (NAD)
MTATENRILDEAVWHGKAFTGSWNATAGGISDVLEKATGTRLSSVGLAVAEDVAGSARIAVEAQVKWAAVSHETRSKVFRNAARIITENGPEFAEWIIRETGAVAPKADVELHMAEGILYQSAAMPTEPQGIVLPSTGDRLSIARRVPHGVVGVISPFNFPLILSIRAVSPALATGNAVILKPDLRTPVSGGFVIARIFEEAGLPAGLLHVLPGGVEAGEALCTDPRVTMIAFTGSTAIGRKVGALAGAHLKKVSLELGGNNSLIILDDADLEAAASNARWGAWLHQGQICMTAGRILVQEKVAEALVDRLVQVANVLPVGNPFTTNVALGPIVDEAQLQRVDGIVRDSVAAGAHLKAGGTYEGLFYRPTVLDSVTPGMRAFDEEIFGPVASVTRFCSDDEAIALANQTEFGLSASVISGSVSRALALGNQLRTGLLHINDQTVADEPHVPFGGRGASGNGTRIGGPANWEEFTQWQWLTIKDKATPYPF